MPKTKTSHWNCVAIVGVGLIGGSIGIDLLQRGAAQRVIGIGRRASTLRTAKRMRAITSGTTRLESGVEEADLVIVCTPVDLIAETVCRAASACPAATHITDAGSVKRSIVAALDGTLPKDAHFVGSHPLAGSEQSGPAAAVAGLFKNRTVVVTPTRHNTAAEVRKIRKLWTWLGSRVVEMSPEEHDELLAQSSHLPHLVASALAAATPEECAKLVATGWTDTTRIAAGDPRLWREIMLANSDRLLTALAQYEKVLASFAGALGRSDAATLERLLADAKRKRDAMGS